MEPPPSPVPGPSWAAAAPEGATSATATVERLGRYCWAEQELFALLGGWAPEIPEHDVAALVAEQAEHAAWRAERWFELLPGAPGTGLVVAPEGLDDLGDRARQAADGPTRTVEKLAVAYRLLAPRLVAAYVAHLGWATPHREAAARRLLGIAVADLTGDLVEGERLLQALATGPDAVSRVAAAVGPLERAVVVAGGIVGDGSLGVRPS
ncbi:MAG: hypothetical protein MUE36_10685 [Acidimicrobiales bacterium]|jgi:hypothetical protein|nr:hypothetical protein [Acidimicrobiales bacterium]